MSDARSKRQTAILIGVAIVGLACVVLLANLIDVHRAQTPPAFVEQERLYLSGNTARQMSLGFNGFAADWYWMRSLQYVGRKIMNAPENLVIDDLGQLNLKLLGPLLDTATTLDPQFLEPYEYAAVVLPGIDRQEAIRITSKGIVANPNAWRLYQHLGYIYWQQHDYKTASQVYGEGAKVPGAPPWMQAMSARMAAEGGSRDLAREIYARMFAEATDEKVKDMARRRLLQLDFFDQRDALRQILAAFRQRFSRCPASWPELASVMRNVNWQRDANGNLLDPSGTPYVLNIQKCDVELDPSSEVPPR